MYVRDKMTQNPTCITKDTSILSAYEMMEQHDFHRIPVVEGTKLIGLITAGVILENMPSKATSLSRHELNYLLSKNNVEEIMIRDVIAIHPDDLLVEAAVRMRKADIGCLVVVDKENTVEGIITQNDIFDAFIDVLGYYADGDRYVIEIEEDKPGVLAKLTNLFFTQNGLITSLAVHHLPNTIEVVIRAANVDKKEMLVNLKENGFVAR